MLNFFVVADDRDRRKGGHLLLEGEYYLGFYLVCKQLILCNVIHLTYFTGARRDTEDRLIPRSVDADDADVEVKSDERFAFFGN